MSRLILLWSHLLSASFVRRKVQALIIMRHHANLGWWGAQFPAQGDAFAIYLWERKTWFEDKTAAAGVYSCNKLLPSLVKCLLIKGLTLGTCSRAIALVQPLPDLKWSLSSGITVQSWVQLNHWSQKFWIEMREGFNRMIFVSENHCLELFGSPLVSFSPSPQDCSEAADFIAPFSFHWVDTVGFFASYVLYTLI